MSLKCYELCYYTLDVKLFYYKNIKIVALMAESASTSETSVNFYRTTWHYNWHYNSERSHLHNAAVRNFNPYYVIFSFAVTLSDKTVY
jgi:hypothetical protein